MAEMKWKSQEEIDKEREEEERKKQLPTEKERLEFLEQTVIEMMIENMTLKGGM